MTETLAFWDILKMGKYDVYISDAVVDELDNCPEPKRTELVALLEEITYTEIKTVGNDEIADIADQIAGERILPDKSVNDRFHIAAAIYTGCHIIVSWNFKHLVNIRTIDGVRVIAALSNLSAVDICSPTMLLEGSDSNG
jgi:predicted nucleic acid-binding protein